MSDLDVVTATALVQAPPEQVAALFWDIDAWHRIWLRIDEVEVRYDDLVHQEFVMAVQRDGRQENVRTVRYRRDDGDIEFFTPQPPPTMDRHRGTWRFTADPDHPGRCRVDAGRAYRLIRDPRHDDDAHRSYRTSYARRFSRRLQAILDCFVEHHATDSPAAEVGV